MIIDKNYDYDATVTGVIDAFEVPIQCKNITAQIFYTGLDKSDSVVSIKQSQGMGLFDDITDPSGNKAEIALVHTNASTTLNIVNIVTRKIEVSIDNGTLTTGTITRIIYQFLN